MIVQLCSFSPYHKLRQSAMGAILMASAVEKIDAQGSGYRGDVFAEQYQITPQISDREGAGILNAYCAFYIVASGNGYAYTVNTNSQNFSQTIYIDTSQNTLNRVALFWLKKNTTFLQDSHESEMLNDNPILTNLNLSIYDPNGQIVCSSSLINNNYEILQFIPNMSGNYTIVVTGFGYVTEHIGIAIW